MKNFFAGVEARQHHAWPAGRRDLHWHVLPDEETARQLIEPYEDLLTVPGLYAVPPQWLHLTVLHAGPQQDTSDDELAAIVERVRADAAEIAPFDVVLERPGVGWVALERAGHPGAPARRLWKLTSQAHAAVLGDRVPVTPAAYQPHLSIAYAGTGAELADRAQLKVVLSDIEGGPVVLRAEKLSLVSQWHNGENLICWEHLLDVPLGG
ncbi:MULTISPECIES: 2'-5' RNA ligase family protein [unclassified Kitasatospora]|uniref:2'-5' RNA ligase family protein n=1 Tax=unclassified Kitasatospora TaxID=2633591 RepID=UPI002473C892|nr:2'-5' RNA ligase family protein [Kitasatospora sp. MAP12-44]